MICRMALGLLILPAMASGQMTPAVRRGLGETLSIANLTEADLEYEKKVVPDPYRMLLAKQALDHPLDAADDLMSLHAKGEGTMADLLRAVLQSGFGERPKAADPSEGAVAAPAVPEPLRRPLTRLIDAIADANASVRSATAKLGPAQRRALLESLPQWAVENPSVKFEFVKQPMMPPSQMLAELAKVDLVALRAAGYRLAAQIQRELPTLRSLARTVRLKDSIFFVTRGVTVELSGQGDDLHVRKDANLCLDLGGNDTYRGRYGAGSGYASVLIDCGGNDTYDVPDLSVGAGVLGVGLAYDLGGKDEFRGKSLCFGAGLAGVGILSKDGGDDRFVARSLAEGFAMFGVGVLLDSGGDDVYELGSFGQGCARTGGFGWLADQSGDDLYRSTSKVSAAQGCSMGWETGEGMAGGGVGLLTDAGGRDVYQAETFAQGAARWGGVGSLADEAGNDLYGIDHEGQAYATHAGASYLFDLEGDDSYVTRAGACHATGHDNGVAMLLDREGNDVYAARDSRPGSGIAGGLGVFVDAAGDDRYMGPPAAGFGVSVGSSLGIFCDLGGPDQYGQGLADGEARVDGSLAVAYDVASGTGESVTIPPARPTPRAGTLPVPPPADLDRLFNQAIRGDLDAQDRLIAIGNAAVEWLLANRLGTLDAAGRRVLGTTIRGVGDSAATLLANKVADPQEGTARQAILVAEEAKLTQLDAQISGVLNRPSLQREGARAAGILRLKAALPDLLVLTAAPDRALATQAMVALEAIGDESSAATAQAALTSPELPLRRAALRLVAKFPASARLAANRLLGDGQESVQRTGLGLLARLGDEPSLNRLGEYLSRGSAGLTIQALQGLDGRVPVAYRARVTQLRQDPNPLIRAVALRTDFGR